LDSQDFTAVTNNFLHSLFSQYNVTLNGMSITQSCDPYQYFSYMENLLLYGSDAAASHLTNSFCYLDKSDMLPCDTTAAQSATTNSGFIIRSNRFKQNNIVEFYSRLHCDLCNVPLFLLPGVRLQMKLTKHDLLCT
jgi:hypothetical protein